MYNFTSVIFSIGHLDAGDEHIWSFAENVIIDNFSKLQKEDFSMALIGFCMSSTP